MALNDTINELGNSIINLVDKKRHGTLGLEQGDVGYDKEVLADIYKYKHSTFDRSKFEVVGSPNITEDGVASGLRANNYVETSNTITIKEKTIIKFSYNISSKTATSSVYLCNLVDLNLFIYKANSGYFSIAQSPNYGTTISVNAYQLGVVDFELVLENNTAICFISQNGVTLGNVQLSNVNYIGDTKIRFGTHKDSSIGATSGESINLKQFSITVDGREVFNGNKTGIYVIKEDNYTVVGSPVISEDGVASGFSANNFLYSAGRYDISGNFRLEISDIIFSKTNSSIGVCQLQGNGATISINENWGDFRIVLTDGTNSISVITSQGLNQNKLTSLIVEVKNGTVVITAQQEGLILTKTADISSLDMTKFYNSRLMIGKAGWFGNDIYSVDLNAFKIYVDGNLVYQPCLKIPYTQSKTGSKIVDEFYRDRVIDLYEQEGHAEYYTIQEGKKGNYTLVGSPTISGDWVASGFNRNQDYILVPFTFNTTSTYKIQLTVETPSTSVVNGYLLYGNFFEIYCNSGDFGFIYRDNSSNWYSIGRYNFQPNTKYHIYCEFNLSTLNLAFGVKKDGDTDYQVYSTIMSSYLTPTTITHLGDTNNEYSIYLNDFKIYADGKLAYQAVTPPSYTLPMGDVYGVLSAKTNSSEISRYSMPSDKYVDLTLGESGSTYTAPANGWFILSYTATNDNCYVSVVAGGLISEHFTSVAKNYGSNSVPCRKGQTCLVNYRNMAKRNFRFVYAEGEI